MAKFALVVLSLFAHQIAANPTTTGASAPKYQPIDGDDEWVLFGDAKVPKWEYDNVPSTYDFPPEKWGNGLVAAWKTCGKTGPGSRQSPVEIDDDDAEYQSYPPINFTNFEVPLKVVVRNHYRYVMATMGCASETDKKCVRPGISGGPLPPGEEYAYVESRMHIGALGAPEGSEQQIEGQTASMQLTRIYFNIKYNSFAEAAVANDGLVYTTIFFKEDPNHKDQVTLNKVKKLVDGTIQGNSSFILSLPKFSESIWGLRPFIPKWSSRFYTYEGSRTTPPCTENVRHIVFPDTVTVSPDEVAVWRQPVDENQRHLVGNFRPIVEDSDVKVYKSFQSQSTVAPSPSTPEASSTAPTTHA